MMNDVKFVVEEKTEKIKAIVQFQTVMDKELFNQFTNSVWDKNDGTFNATLE